MIVILHTDGNYIFRPSFVVVNKTSGQDKIEAMKESDKRTQNISRIWHIFQYFKEQYPYFGDLIPAGAFGLDIIKEDVFPLNDMDSPVNTTSPFIILKFASIIGPYPRLSVIHLIRQAHSILGELPETLADRKSNHDEHRSLLGICEASVPSECSCPQHLHKNALEDAMAKQRAKLTQRNKKNYVCCVSWNTTYQQTTWQVIQPGPHYVKARAITVKSLFTILGHLGVVQHGGIHMLLYVFIGALLFPLQVSSNELHMNIACPFKISEFVLVVYQFDNQNSGDHDSLLQLINNARKKAILLWKLTDLNRSYIEFDNKTFMIKFNKPKRSRNDAFGDDCGSDAAADAVAVATADVEAGAIAATAGAAGSGAAASATTIVAATAAISAIAAAAAAADDEAGATAAAAFDEAGATAAATVDIEDYGDVWHTLNSDSFDPNNYLLLPISELDEEGPLED